MKKILAPIAPYAFASLRTIAGLLFVAHGEQKVFGWFGGPPVPLGSIFGMAGIIEIVLGLLITIGLLTSFAAFIASAHQFCSVHRQRPNGGRLFYRPFPKRFLAARKRR